MPHAAIISVLPFSPAPSVDDPAVNDDLDSLGPAVLRAERRLRDLEELTAIGLDITRALHRRVLGDEEAATVSTAVNGDIDVSAKPAASKPSRFDPTAAFARLSRAVCLIINLEIRADEALRALQAGEIGSRETRRAERRRRGAVADEERHKAARDKVSDRVTAVIDIEAKTDSEYGDLMEAMIERLDEDSAYDHLGDKALGEMVERLCDDLKLSPDWRHWTGQDWTPESRPRRPRCSIFNTPSRKPFFPDQPDTPNHLE
jgi:hypothetical protein